jgi:hypothetical protein
MMMNDDCRHVIMIILHVFLSIQFQSSGSHRSGPGGLSMMEMLLPSMMMMMMHDDSNDDSKRNNDDNSDSLPFILLASINSGEGCYMLLYDSRILHRGRGYGNSDNYNSNGNSATNNKITKQELEHRPVLVIRWDAHHSPAPGTGMIGTQLAKFQGEALALVATLIDWFS